jgi:hypothetical protein
MIDERLRNPNYDTQGFVMAVNITPGGVSDQAAVTAPIAARLATAGT